MQNTKIVGLFFAFSSLAISGQAQEKPVLKTTPGYELKDNQLPAAYNAPAGIKVSKPWNCFANASFIYWQPNESAMEIAIINPTNHETHAVRDYTLSCDFHPGFKVSLGFNTNFDNWDTYVEYVRLHTRDVNRFNTPDWAHNLLDLFTYHSENNIRTVFKLNYDMLNWSLGRYFYNGKNLSLFPKLGIKGGWINQHLTNTGESHTSAPALLHADYKSTSWLVGPQVGLDSKWLFGKGFRLFENADLSLLYQSFNATGIITDETNETTTYKISPSVFLPNFGLILGLGWGSYYNCQKFHFDLSAGYEFQYYFHQSILRRLIVLESYITPVMPDLMLQGLTVKAQFDF